MHQCMLKSAWLLLLEACCVHHGAGAQATPWALPKVLRSSCTDCLTLHAEAAALHHSALVRVLWVGSSASITLLPFAGSSFLGGCRRSHHSAWPASPPSHCCPAGFCLSQQTLLTPLQPKHSQPFPPHAALLPPGDLFHLRCHPHCSLSFARFTPRPPALPPFPGFSHCHNFC